MFTGIITEVGKIKLFEKKGAVWLLEISNNFDVNKIDIGASIACNGVCLTVVEKASKQLVFELSPETVNLTTYKNIKVGDYINLETSLKVGDELGGHYVSGHVDGVAEAVNVEKDDDNWIICFSSPKNLRKYIAKKGSICLNGVSLTVNKVEENNFYVNVIPHTLKNTNLGEVEAGKFVNLEVDIFSRYIEQINKFEENE